MQRHSVAPPGAGLLVPLLVSLAGGGLATAIWGWLAGGLTLLVGLAAAGSRRRPVPVVVETVAPAPAPAPPPRPAFDLSADIAAVRPFTRILAAQIDGVQADTAQAVGDVLAHVEQAHGLSSDQLARLRTTLATTDVLERAATLPGQIIARLETQIAERDARLLANFSGLQVLADEFQAMRAMVEIITQIASKAFFLSINAAVEAKHCGQAGAAFGLIAEEMRRLSTQTSAEAKTVADGIEQFAERLRIEIARALPRDEGDPTRIEALLIELRAAQTHLATLGETCAGEVQRLEAGHARMITILSEMLGRLQFHDVVRQRLEAVSAGLGDLATHTDALATGRRDGPGVVSLIGAQRGRYVMNAQRAAHDAADGSNRPTTRPQEAAIELF